MTAAELWALAQTDPEPAGLARALRSTNNRPALLALAKYLYRLDRIAHRTEEYQFHAGTVELAKLAGCSKAALWRRLRQLERAGVIEQVERGLWCSGSKGKAVKRAAEYAWCWTG